MPITQLGGKTQTIFLKGIEMHKLHHEFEVRTGNTVKKGQPVVLHTDGTIMPAPDSAPTNTIIGWSIHNAAAGEHATVGMRAMGIVWAMPNGTLNAGPVAYDGMNDEDGDFNSFKALAAIDPDVYAANDICGWALDQALAADQLIRVAIYS